VVGHQVFVALLARHLVWCYGSGIMVVTATVALQLRYELGSASEVPSTRLLWHSVTSC
jgi:hypothetical protein